MGVTREPAIYIAGPMRGYPEHNYPAFNRATELFRSRGWTVWSPVEIGDEAFGDMTDVPGGEFLRLDIAVIAQCTAIALLPGWEASTGARCEAACGVSIGLLFFDAITGDPIPAPERIIIQGGYERPPGLVDDAP